jgi:hypothetical protein
MNVVKNFSVLIVSFVFQIFSWITSFFQYMWSLVVNLFYGVGGKYIQLSVEEKDLKCETHRSLTKDGYVINSQRILPKVQNENNKRAVFFQHGFMETGGAFIVYEDSLAIQLAKLGYDVWIGHNRGSKRRIFNFQVLPTDKITLPRQKTNSGTTTLTTLLKMIYNVK